MDPTHADRTAAEERRPDDGVDRPVDDGVFRWPFARFQGLTLEEIAAQPGGLDYLRFQLEEDRLHGWPKAAVSAFLEPVFYDPE